MRNHNWETFLSELQGKRCAVLGIGISNKPLIRLLARHGADVTAFDRREARHPAIRDFCDELSHDGLFCRFSLGETYLRELKNFEIIFRTPVIRPDLPEIMAERRRGARLSSEMELFFSFCPAEITAVTGSDGKTTCSTLIHQLQLAMGFKSWLGGNIGTPLLDRIEDIAVDDKVVVELSSFQLQSMSVSPHTAVITNLQPNHLDVHRDYEEYREAKTNIFRHQRVYDRLVLNGECQDSLSFATETPGSYLWVGRRPFGEAPLYGLDGALLYYQASATAAKQELLRREDILLPGRFNALNYLTAAAAVGPELRLDALRNLARRFGGVEHRLERVDGGNFKIFYNSSIDSSPQRSIQSLSVFAEKKEKIILIMGGKDKASDYSGLGVAILQVAEGLLLCGQNGDMIESALRREAGELGADLPLLRRCATLEEAVIAATDLARPRQAIVFSPAGTSFDQFENFMERGERFKELVRSRSHAHDSAGQPSGR